MERVKPGHGALRACSVCGCPRPHAAKGYCMAHYCRWKATGNPLPQARKARRPRTPAYGGPKFNAASPGQSEQLRALREEYLAGWMAQDMSRVDSAVAGMRELLGHLARVNGPPTPGPATTPIDCTPLPALAYPAPQAHQSED